MSATPVPSLWNIANALTIVRILLVPLYGWLLLFDGGAQPAYRHVAALCFAVAMATDRMDGDLARRRGLVTDFGKVADPIADKALIGMALIGLSVLGLIPWWLTVLVLAREWGVTALRFWVIRHGVLPASRGGKAKTALQGLALLLFTLPLHTYRAGDVWTLVAWAILIAAVVITVITGMDYVHRALRLRATSERTMRKRRERRERLERQRRGETEVRHERTQDRT